MKQYEDNCPEIENNLPLYVGGDLEEPAASEVARHLTECSACKKREQAARSARDLMVSALVLSERRGPELWPGVRAGLVRENVLQPEPQPQTARTRAPSRLRLLSYAAAAAALLAGVWVARTAFDTHDPLENGPDEPPIVVENHGAPAPHGLPTPPVIPVRMSNSKDSLRLLGRNERRLSEGAEIYSEIPLDQGLGTNVERWHTTPVLRRP